MRRCWRPQGRGVTHVLVKQDPAPSACQVANHWTARLLLCFWGAFLWGRSLSLPPRNGLGSGPRRGGDAQGAGASGWPRGQGLLRPRPCAQTSRSCAVSTWRLPHRPAWKPKA